MRRFLIGLVNLAALSGSLTLGLQAQACDPRLGACQGKGKRRALIVGISDYHRLQEKDKLNFADDDANEFARVLRSDISRWRVDSAIVLIDSQATELNIRRALVNIVNDSKELAEVIIYFAGHAKTQALGVEQPAYWLTYDAEYNGVYTLGGGVSLSEVGDRIRGLQLAGVNATLIIDACRGGDLMNDIAARMTTAQNIATQTKAPRLTQLISTSGQQLASEDSKWGNGHGVFTYFLLRGLTGDREATKGTNTVTARDLRDYLEDKVGAALNGQSPTLLGLDKRDTLIVVDEEIRRRIADLNLFSRPSSVTGAAVSGRRTLDETPDSATVALVSRFRAAVQDGRLIGDSASAITLFSRITRDTAQSAMRAQLRDELLGALDTRISAVLRRYLAGGNDQPTANEYRQATQFLAGMLSIIPDNEAFSKSYRARHAFLYGYTIVKEGNRRRYAEAIDSLRASVALDPDAAYAYNGLGMLYDDQERLDEAEAAYRKAIQLAPMWDYPRNNLGNVQLSRGRYAQAMREYRHAIDSLPGSGYHPRYNLALVYGRLGRTREAERWYREAIVSAPDRPVAHYSLAQLYRRSYRTSDAERELAIALKLDSLKPSHDRYLRITEATFEIDKKHALEAKQALERAAKDDPYYGQPWGALGELYAGTLFGDKGLAARAFLTAIAVDSLYLYGYDALARQFETDPQPQLLIQQLRTDAKADTTLLETAALDRLTIDAMTDGIAIAERISQRPLSMMVYAKSASAHVNASVFYRRRAIAMRASSGSEAEVRKHFRTADSLLRVALKLDPLYDDAYEELADLYLEAGEHATAVEFLKTAEEKANSISGVDGKSTYAPYRLAEVLLRPEVENAIANDGPRDLALAALNRALAIDSMYPQAHQLLARLYEQREDPMAAARHYVRASASGFPEYKPEVYASNLLLLARRLQDRGNDAETIEAAKSALVLEPLRIDALKTAARSYYRLGRTDSALVMLDSATKLASRPNARGGDARSRAELTRMQADALMEQAIPDQAAFVRADSLLDAATQLRKTDPAILISRARLALRRKDVTNAKAFILKAIEAYRSKEAVLESLGRLQYHADAKLELERILRDLDRGLNTSTGPVS